MYRRRKATESSTREAPGTVASLAASRQRPSSSSLVELNSRPHAARQIPRALPPSSVRGFGLREDANAPAGCVRPLRAVRGEMWSLATLSPRARTNDDDGARNPTRGAASRRWRKLSPCLSIGKLRLADHCDRRDHDGRAVHERTLQPPLEGGEGGREEEEGARDAFPRAARPSLARPPDRE